MDCNFSMTSPVAGTSNEEQLAAPLSSAGLARMSPKADASNCSMDEKMEFDTVNCYSKDSQQIYDYPPQSLASSLRYANPPSGGYSMDSYMGYYYQPQDYGYPPQFQTPSSSDFEASDRRPQIPLHQSQPSSHYAAARPQQPENYFEYRKRHLNADYSNSNFESNYGAYSINYQNSSQVTPNYVNPISPPYAADLQTYSGGGIRLQQEQQQQSQHNSIRQLSSGMQRVQLWNQHNAPAAGFQLSQRQQQQQQQQQHQDSGVHSMTHSSATSVMSSIHAASQISGVSSLPDNDVYGNSMQLTDQQKARFHNIPSSFRHASPDEIRDTLPELITLLTDSDEDVVCRALHILQSIVITDCSDALYGSGSCAQATIDGIFHALKTFKNNKVIIRAALRTLYYISVNRRYGIHLLIQKIDKTNAQCLNELLDAIRIRELSCFKYAILILHSLMVEPKVSRTVIRHARDERALAQIVDRLTERNEKFIIIVIEIVRHIVDRDADQKAFFCSLKGPFRLICIMETARYDNLLLRTAKLLSSISNYDPKLVVEAGAFDVLHLRLQHADRRLVRELLVCLRNLSDVPTSGRDVSALLAKLIHVFGFKKTGKDELKIRQTCAQLLANLSANNPTNKSFLVRNGVIDAAFCALFETETLLERTRNGAVNHSSSTASANGQQLEEIQDSTLTLLGNVCSGHDLAWNAQRQIMQRRPNGDILLQKMAKKRVVLLRRTLRILCQTATNDANLARFREVIPLQTLTKDPPIVPYVKEIVECFQIAAENHKGFIEGVALADLVQDSMTILQYLCRDNSLLNTIVLYLRRSPITVDESGAQILLPQFALRDENLRMKALSFLSELARHPQASHCLARDDETMRILNFHAAAITGNATNNAAACARRCLDWIQKYSAQFLRNFHSPCFGADESSAQYANVPQQYLNHMTHSNSHSNNINTENLQGHTTQQVGVSSRGWNCGENGASTQDQHYRQHNYEPENRLQAPLFYANQPSVSDRQQLPDCMASSKPAYASSGRDANSSSAFSDVSSASLNSHKAAMEGDIMSTTESGQSGASFTVNEDEEFGGAAARCSTPVDASALQATIGAVSLDDPFYDATANKRSTDVREFNWDSAEMDASTTTIVGDSTGHNFQQLNLYDEDFSIANAICGVPKMS